MNTDCKATRPFNAIKQTLSPLIGNSCGTCGKTLALSLALFLGACASTVDKPVESQSTKAQVADTQAPAKADEPASTEPAPTAAELMQTLRAPLKEPEPARPDNTAETAAKAKKENAINADEPKAVAESVEKSAEKTAGMAESTTQTIPEGAPKKTVAVTPPPAKTATSEAEPVAQKASTAVVQQVSELDAKPFSVTAKQLPFTYDIWTIRKGNTPLTQGLVIVTPTWEMGKEGYMSQIWLTLMEDKIHVNSSSDIETASKGLGIRIDGGDLIPFTRVAETNIGVIEGKWLDRLAKAGKIDIYLGFFPGKKPMSDTFKSDLSMSNLDRVVATYRVLNR